MRVCDEIILDLVELVLVVVVLVFIFVYFSFNIEERIAFLSAMALPAMTL